MDLGDVSTLDAAYESFDSWMGCIVCPLLGADGNKNMVDLLQKVKRVPFYKLKSGDGEAHYSRQTTMGARLPTKFSACPEPWPDVSAEISLWAWNGGSIIGSQICKCKEKGNMVDKVMMCNRWRAYKSTSPQEVRSPLPAPPLLTFYQTIFVAPTLVYCDSSPLCLFHPP
jgi:hypothetical protein